MANHAQCFDPIGNRFFKPLKTTDSFSNWLFYITAFLSFAALLVDQKEQPGLYNGLQSAFVICAVGLFTVGHVIRLYLWPRAETKRRQDFLSYSLGTNLTHLQSSGYYNNNETDPIRRMGAAILENTHFTKGVALEMCKSERLQTAFYVILWLVMLLNRNSDLGWLAIAAQVLFSEQLVSRAMRIEWLRIKAEEIHNELLKIFGSAPSDDALRAYVIEAFASYETTKANAGVVLSSKVFVKLNAPLSDEWAKIKKTSNIN